MRTQRATLCVTPGSDVDALVSRLVADLAVGGVANTALAKLVGDAAVRLQRELSDRAIHGETVLRTPEALITVTTRTPGWLTRLMVLLGLRGEVYS